MNLTRDQLRAVTLRDRDACVLAGAGSGKTRVLVERTVGLVTGGEMRIPEILAITFTEKAAREMKKRLAEAFEKKGRAGERAEVEWAYVSTIHGFCSRLIRENAVEAGVDPFFEVLDEVQAGTIRREVVEDVSEVWIAERPDDHESLLRLGLSEARMAEDLLDFYEALRGAGVAPGDVAVPEPDSARLDALLEGIVAAVEPAVDLVPELPPKSAERARDAVAALPALRALIGTGPDFPEMRDALVGLRSVIHLNVAIPLKEILASVKNEAIVEALREAAESLARPSLLALRDFLGDVDGRYGRRKEDLGVLDFADLETKARSLLAGHPEVRATVQGRFRQVLVDEYQDVNPVQAEIIGLVRAEGNHFAVGDVKQSIYGFRHAEPTIFRRRAEAAGEEGRIVLRENFRSSPGLVEFANHCFSRLFAGDGLVDWTDMVAAAEYAPEEAPEVEVVLSAGEDARAARGAEARALAVRIRRLVDDGETRIRRAGADEPGRPVSFGDVAVLFRALTDVKLYERAFEDLDIPFYVVKGRGFYQARELVDLARLLRTVVNPRDDVSLAAALRSPFAGLTDDGLLSLALAARRGDGLLADLLPAPDSVPGLSAGDREAWLRFVTLHDRLRDRAARGPIRDVVETALDESGYATAVWGLRGGRRRAANLRKALALADSFEGRFDLREFVGALEDFRAREIRETEAPTGGEEEDVVRLLTVHAAKGLEFPVVVLPDLSRRAVVVVPALLHGESGVAARVAEFVGGSPLDTASYHAAKEARRAAEEAEARRLLYVAVTRAEEKLILAARDEPDGPSEGSFWGYFTSVLEFDEDGAPYGDTGRRAVRIRGRDGPPPTRRISLLSRNRARLASAEPLTPPPPEAREHAARLAARAERPRPDPDASAYENTVSELLAFATCRGCWFRKYVLGIRDDLTEEPESREGEERGEDELPRTAYGSLVHEVLRLWTPGADAAPLVEERAGGNDRLAAEVESMIRAFADSDVGGELRRAPAGDTRREVPFLVRWEPQGAPRGFLFRGQLDLLYRRPSGALRIVDYKTGKPSAAYHLQLAAYARALRELGEPDVEAALVYLAPDRAAEVEEVDLTPELEARVEEAAADFSRWLARGAPRPDGHDRDCYGAAKS